MFRYARTSNICGLLCLQDIDIGYQLPENALFSWYKNQVKNLFLHLLPFTDHVYYNYFYTIYNK